MTLTGPVHFAGYLDGTALTGSAAAVTLATVDDVEQLTIDEPRWWTAGQALPSGVHHPALTEWRCCWPAVALYRPAARSTRAEHLCCLLRPWLELRSQRRKLALNNIRLGFFSISGRFIQLS